MGQAEDSEKLEAQVDDAEVWFDRGKSSFELREYEESVFNCDRAIELHFACIW